MTFKVGDIVRCTADSQYDSSYNLVIGQEYEITEVSEGKYITFKGVRQLGHMPNRFDLAEQSTIQGKVIRKIKEMEQRRKAVAYG